MKANKKFSVYLSPEAVSALDTLIFNSCKNNQRVSQSEIISQALISYYHQLSMTRRLDNQTDRLVTHYEVADTDTDKEKFKFWA